MITIDGTGAEVQVRAEHIDGGGRQSLQQGARVAFSLQKGPQGSRAIDVYLP